MFSVTSWFDVHRNEIMAHYKQFPIGSPCRASEPKSDAWWIMNAATGTITTMIYTVIIRLQGHRLALSQQESSVKHLIANISLTICASRDLEIEDESTHVVRDDWSASTVDITNFIEDLDHFAMMALRSLDAPSRVALTKDVAYFVFDIASGFLE